MARYQHSPASGGDGTPRPHRLAVAIVQAATSPCFVRTLHDWAETGAGAVSTLRMWCYASGLRPRDVTAFVRALSAISQATRCNEDPVDLLDFADERSLDRFLGRSGPLRTVSAVVSVSDFCRRQTFICHARIITDVIRLTGT